MTTLGKLSRAAAVASLLSLTSVGAHAVMQDFTPLPAPNCGTVNSFDPTNNCIQYGDFSVYSLAFLYSLAVYSNTGIWPTTNPNPGDPYYVASSPGELGNDGYIVYGTGTNNSNVVTNGAGTLIDDAQEQPSGVTSTFAVGSGTETTPTFTGDDPNQWSGQIAAITSELALGSDPNGQFVIYFNLNETGNDGLEGIDLLAWFKVTLQDAQGILPDVSFYLTGDPGDTTPPAVGDLADNDWVYVHGTICASPAGFLGFGPCTDAQTAAGGRNVNQNLGANTAAFAMYNEELSNLLFGGGYDYIQGEWRFAMINNGYEQMFSALVQITQVAEPASLTLFGLGLLLLGVQLRKRKSA